MSISTKAIANMSESTRRLNPHLCEPPGNFGLDKISTAMKPANPTPPRIRQDKPVKENQWEQQFRARLERQGIWTHLVAQSINFRLANGAKYKPDICGWRYDNQMFCWDVKGGKEMKGAAKGVLAIKVAATAFPKVCWNLVWKDENGEWQEQEVRP